MKDLKCLDIVLVSAVALIDVEDRILISQRPQHKSMGGLWEFPGGKIETSETPENAIIRELKEELDIDVSESCLAPLTFASHCYDNFHLVMFLYICRVWNGIPVPKEKQKIKWVAPSKLNEYPMPPADKPLIPLLNEFL